MPAAGRLVWQSAYHLPFNKRAQSNSIKTKAAVPHQKQQQLTSRSTNLRCKHIDFHTFRDLWMLHCLRESTGLDKPAGVGQSQCAWSCHKHLAVLHNNCYNASERQACKPHINLGLNTALPSLLQHHVHALMMCCKAHANTHTCAMIGPSKHDVSSRGCAADGNLLHCASRK